mmetsp:Transcript_1683/g.6698  ORF Transcript_1683/g.6698 Transcript_1683/m.6698 type:complete len:256 (-) Transcript_1683:106-873(-)
MTMTRNGGNARPYWSSPSDSRRRRCTPLIVPNRKSVCNVRSCASSIMITPYFDSKGSPTASRRSIPSVRNFMRVSSLETSSNRMAYPTSVPCAVPVSSATRRDTDTAATRLGCVTPIINPFVSVMSSYTYCGICVVFPLPVSPMMMTVSLFLISSINRSFARYIGSDFRTRSISSLFAPVGAPFAFRASDVDASPPPRSRPSRSVSMASPARLVQRLDRRLDVRRRAFLIAQKIQIPAFFVHRARGRSRRLRQAL